MSTDATAELLRQARQFSRQREYPAAIEVYRKILSADADSVAAHEGLAMVCFVAGDYAAAEQEFQRLAQLEPREVRHCVNLGAVYNRVGDHHKAQDVLRKAIQRDRRSADAYYNLGIAHRKLNQTSMATSAYKEAIRLNPQMAEAYQNLGNIYVQSKNYPLAISNFRKALELRPDFEKARVGLEQAEEATRQVKSTHNPFGRLVSTDAASIRSAIREQRTLTNAERLVDRQRVRQMADELSSLLADGNAFLRTQFEPAIMDLERSVAEGDFSGLSFGRAARRFADAFEAWTQLQIQMKRTVLELRSHEELVATPGALTEP